MDPVSIIGNLTTLAKLIDAQVQQDEKNKEDLKSLSLTVHRIEIVLKSLGTLPNNYAYKEIFDSLFIYSNDVTVFINRLTSLREAGCCGMLSSMGRAKSIAVEIKEKQDALMMLYDIFIGALVAQLSVNNNTNQENQVNFQSKFEDYLIEISGKLRATEGDLSEIKNIFKNQQGVFLHSLNTQEQHTGSDNPLLSSASNGLILGSTIVEPSLGVSHISTQVTESSVTQPVPLSNTRELKQSQPKNWSFFYTLSNQRIKPSSTAQNNVEFKKYLWSK